VPTPGDGRRHYSRHLQGGLWGLDLTSTLAPRLAASRQPKGVQCRTPWRHGGLSTADLKRREAGQGRSRAGAGAKGAKQGHTRPLDPRHPGAGASRTVRKGSCLVWGRGTVLRPHAMRLPPPLPPHLDARRSGVHVDTSRPFAQASTASSTLH
jgi:hypothetical protein